MGHSIAGDRLTKRYIAARHFVSEMFVPKIVKICPRDSTDELYIEWTVST